MRRRLLMLTAAAGAVLMATSCTTGSGGGTPQPEDGIGTAENWTAPQGNVDEAGYSRLTQIGTGNVGKLGLAWSMDLPDEVTLESTPLQVDGTLHFSGGYAEVYALDAVTGKLKWKFDPKTWQRRPDKFHFGANRGIAYEDGRIFTVEMDGTVDALDAQTGKVLWSAQSIPDGPAFQFTNSTGAPRTMNGKVIIGNGGAEYRVRGYVTAYDSETGEQLWRWWTVPGDPTAETARACATPRRSAGSTWSSTRSTGFGIGIGIPRWRLAKACCIEDIR